MFLNGVLYAWVPSKGKGQAFHYNFILKFRSMVFATGYERINSDGLKRINEQKAYYHNLILVRTNEQA